MLLGDVMDVFAWASLASIQVRGGPGGGNELSRVTSHEVSASEGPIAGLSHHAVSARSARNIRPGLRPGPRAARSRSVRHRRPGHGGCRWRPYRDRHGDSGYVIWLNDGPGGGLARVG
jgi:hypothetical protein